MYFHVLHSTYIHQNLIKSYLYNLIRLINVTASERCEVMPEMNQIQFKFEWSRIRTMYIFIQKCHIKINWCKMTWRGNNHVLQSIRNTYSNK